MANTNLVWKDDLVVLIQETMMEMLMAPVWGDDNTTEAVEVAFLNEGIRTMA